MLTLHELAELRRTLSDQDVLSVYIAAAEHDPTERSSWRLRLTAALDTVEDGVDDTAREALDEARGHLLEELRAYTGFLPGAGWAAFVTTDRVWHCTELPAPMPDLVRWQRGPVLGPYLRALKQHRPVTVILIDSRRARVLSYRDGTLTESADRRADTYIDDLADRNMSKRASGFTGVRGETATDAADRLLRQEADRLAKDVVADVRETDDDGLIVLGGPTTSVTALQKMLEPVVGERLLVDSSMHLMMSSAEIQHAVEEAVSALTGRLYLASVNAVLEDVRPGGRATVGAEDADRACTAGQVERLLLTPQFVADSEAAAEHLIAETLEHAGDVDLVTGDAAELLDERGGGVGVRLRYAQRPAAAATES